jgi:hypothetical protein
LTADIGGAILEVEAYRIRMRIVEENMPPVIYGRLDRHLQTFSGQ